MNTDTFALLADLKRRHEPEKSTPQPYDPKFPGGSRELKDGNTFPAPKKTSQTAESGGFSILPSTPRPAAFS